MKVGFVALIGKPNVGKSTLLNTVVGQHIAIVSDKAQTTRRRMLGIATTDSYQIVFVDTPGVHEPHTHLGKILNETAREATIDVDMILVVVDASVAPSKEDEAIASMLKAIGALKKDEAGRWVAQPKVELCLNKMDLLKAENVVDHVEGYCAMFGTASYMLTSLTKHQNVDKLVDLILQQLPEGEPAFDQDALTDTPMRVLAAELVREKALRLTRQEVPHALASVVDTWEEDPDTGMVNILCSIVVEKPGQKAILIGRGGSMLKRIGTEARLEIEELLGQKVYLELFVKVREEWRQNPRMLRDLEFLP